ncbi:methyl-accepting chemotaxis protein [uncultured Tyzzerella sp.]|uniref:methyl-accepting chemotaxis protein n=1 Tax=uncultured Tyzzerella sp. TaxID=2321398 RepID=UPI002943A44F|nr:methyl-accepting chemotaxis protein [uncultured Tyzzerella sp.]
MNWYKNISLKSKFLITLLLNVILVIILGLHSAGGLHKSNKSLKNDVALNQDITVDIIDSIKDVINIRFTAFQVEFDMDDGNYDVARAKLTDSYNYSKDTLISYMSNLKDFSEENNKDRSELLQLGEEALVLLKDYYDGNINYINLKEQGRIAEAVEQDNATTPIINDLFDIIYSLPNISFTNMVSDLEVSSRDMSSRARSVLVLTIIIVILTLVCLLNLSIIIRKPIEKIKNAAHEVLNGNLNIDIRTNNTDEIGDLSNSISNMSDTIQCIIDDINNLSEQLHAGNTSYRINSEKYKGAFKETTEAINIATNGLVEDAIYVANNIKEIELGNFNNEIKELPGEKEVSTHALKNIQLTLKSVSEEINALINAATNGDLEYKIDSSSYSGQWKVSMDGLNTFIKSVVVPIKETQNALTEFARGNFEHRITNEYKGEFNTIKQTVNYTSETIGSYISEISNILDEMAHKNFDVSIDREYLGDFKNIQKSVNLIVNNLNLLTKDIISSAEQVSAGAKQISESSISLAEGATEQAESVEKLNHIIKVMSKQTTQNTEGSTKANDLAMQTKENAAKGNEQMNNMLIAMEEINAASSSISNIIKVIDDIAFQTNILALNAAVEAARAGEHGKGFAVVAEEVRSLASRSQQAAKETTDLIESSVSKVEQGSKIANQTADALLDIVKQIETISTLVGSCASSSIEQEKSINEVSSAVSQIASVTQNNTATSEESAAASEELASQAEIFYASVADFKLKNDSATNDVVVKQPNNEKPKEKPKNTNNTKPIESSKSTTRNVNNIDLTSDDLIVLDNDADIIINESLDFGKY